MRTNKYADHSLHGAVIRRSIMGLIAVAIIISSSIESAAESTREVQELMYSLGFPIDVDGKFGRQTANEIKRFERLTDMPVTGQITPALIDRLRSIKPPDRWGAIAYTSQSQSFSSWNYSTRREAEDIVSSRLRRRTSDKFIVQTASGSNCVSLAFGQWGSRWGSFSLTEDSFDKAERRVLDHCNRETGVRCRIITTICADGSHAPDQRQKSLTKSTPKTNSKALSNDIGDLENEIKKLQQKLSE